LIKLERFAEAEAVHEEIEKSGDVRPVDFAGVLLSEAFRYKKVGHRREALEKVRAAEKVLVDAKPDRAEQAEVDEMRRQMKTFTDEANSPSKSRSPNS
jgi:hypothetical protein